MKNKSVHLSFKTLTQDGIALRNRDTRSWRAKKKMKTLACPLYWGQLALYPPACSSNSPLLCSDRHIVWQHKREWDFHKHLLATLFLNIFILNTVFLWLLDSLLYTRFKRLRYKIMKRQKEESRHEWESGREELKSQWGLVDKCVCLCGCVWMFVCSSYQY